MNEDVLAKSGRGACIRVIATHLEIRRNSHPGDGLLWTMPEWRGFGYKASFTPALDIPFWPLQTEKDEESIIRTSLASIIPRTIKYPKFSD